jgi:hypothetical protein
MVMKNLPGGARGIGGITGGGGSNVNPVYRETVPKQKRQAAESKATKYNKKLKEQIKSADTKASSDIHIAKNPSGGSKPFSKGNYTPMGPKVPNKKK